MLTCPKCGSPKIRAYYTDPLSYECLSCGAALYDANRPYGIQVLSEAQARRKRPALYNDPECGCCCSHAPHPTGPCEFCSGEQLQVRLAVVVP